MTDTPAKTPDERTPLRFRKGHHPRRRVRWHALLRSVFLAPAPHRRRLANHQRFRPEQPVTTSGGRRSNAPGRSRTDARLLRVIHPPQGHARGHLCTSGSQPPLPLALPLPRFSPPRLARPVGIATVRSRTPEPHSPLRGGELGRERPPPIDRSTVPKPAFRLALLLGVGGRSQPAPTARVIPAGRQLRDDGTTALRSSWSTSRTRPTRLVIPITAALGALCITLRYGASAAPGDVPLLDLIALEAPRAYGVLGPGTTRHRPASPSPSAASQSSTPRSSATPPAGLPVVP